MSSLGDSGLSVFHAGHCDWQRPHSVQVVKSSRPFQVKSSTLPTPSAASSSRSSICSKSIGWPPTLIGCSAPSEVRPSACALGPDVGEREEPVPGDAHRRGERDGDHPRERDEDLHRRDGDDPRLQRLDRQAGEQGPEPPRQREVQPVVLAGVEPAGERVLQPPQKPDAQGHAEDGQLDVVGLPERRAVEPGPPARIRSVTVGPPRTSQLPDDDERDDPDEPAHREDVGHPLVGRPRADQRQRELRVHQLPERVDEREEQHPERDHREPVGHRHHRQPRHPGVPEELPEQGHPPLGLVVGRGTPAGPAGRCGRSRSPSARTARRR